MHRCEFQSRGLGVEEICPSPSHRTFGLDIGVCHETRMRNPGKFQLFHMMWVFRDSALGLRFWSGCVCLPCILGSVLRCIMPLGDLKGDHRSKTYCSASSQRCHFSGPWMLELWVIHGRILVYIRNRGHWILHHIKELLKDLSERIKILQMIMTLKTNKQQWSLRSSLILGASNKSQSIHLIIKPGISHRKMGLWCIHTPPMEEMKYQKYFT